MAFELLSFLLVILFIYISNVFLLPSFLSTTPPSPTPPCFYEGGPHSPTPASPPEHFSTLWHREQDHRPVLQLMSSKAILRYISNWSHGSLHVYSFCGLVSGSSDSLVGWYYCFSYGFANYFSSFNPSTNSFIGVLLIFLMVRCNYPHLYWSDSGRASQGIAIPGSCQQVLLGISNRISVWCELYYTNSVLFG